MHCGEINKAMIVFSFLGGGTLLKTPHVEISSLTVTDVMLVYKEGVWKYAASAPCKSQDEWKRI